MKTRSKARMKKRSDRYVIGYIGAKNLAFGRPTFPESRGGTSTYPLTLSQAKTLLATMPCDDCAIFELVPVMVNG